jgi:ketosteroid isomerase-like protein
MTTTETVVRRYYETVGDLGSTRDELEGLVQPDARFVEHPNAVTPRGATRDVAATVEAFAAGKALLSKQCFDVHEVLVSGDRAAVRATWRGTVGVDRGPFLAGTELRAEVAAFVTVRDGRVAEHETFDCYPSFDVEAP